MATTNTGGVPHKPVSGENGKPIQAAHHKNGAAVRISATSVRVSKVGLGRESYVADEDAAREDRHERKLDGKARSRSKQRLAHERKVSERGYTGRGKKTPAERKRLANKRRVATGTGGLSRFERTARRLLGERAVPTRRELDIELVRGGVEENPGPPKKDRQLSSQEKREMCRQPLDPEVAAEIRSFYNRKLSKREYHELAAAEARYGQRLSGPEADFLAMIGKKDALAEELLAFPPAPSSTVPDAPHIEASAPPEEAAAPVIDASLPDPDPVLVVEELPPGAPAYVPARAFPHFIRHPADPIPESNKPLADEIKIKARHLRQTPLPLPNHDASAPLLPPGVPIPDPPAVRPPVIRLDSQTFEDGDLRGDVLLKNDDRDERLMFAESLFGPNVQIVQATIQRFVPHGEERKITCRGVKQIEKAFEVRHLRVRVGPPLWKCILLYSAVVVALALSFKASNWPLGHFITPILVSAALATYTYHLSGPKMYPVIGLALSTALSYAVSWLPEYIPYHSFLVAILPALPLLGMPYLPRGIRTVSYAPHLVACLLGEYRRGASSDVVASTIHQKMMRLAAFPLPDRTPDWSANTVEAGSEAVALFLNAQVDFGRAPSTPLPGGVDQGAQ